MLTVAAWFLMAVSMAIVTVPVTIVSVVIVTVPVTTVSLAALTGPVSVFGHVVVSSVTVTVVYTAVKQRVAVSMT